MKLDKEVSDILKARECLLNWLIDNGKTKGMAQQLVNKKLPMPKYRKIDTLRPLQKGIGSKE